MSESVKVIQGPDEDGCTPAIGWIELGGVSVALTRRESDGQILLSIEAQGEPVMVEVADMNNGFTLWEGKIF